MAMPPNDSPDDAIDKAMERFRTTSGHYGRAGNKTCQRETDSKDHHHKDHLSFVADLPSTSSMAPIREPTVMTNRTSNFESKLPA